ncbi:MAG: TonB C-terminal domain-containing protein [Deltaproteobacteria bacterium]|nr:TonB C-terminal domain-containing protein [Deltaproteobacteria bacterium]
MEALLTHPASDKSMEQKWSKMFLLSLVLHLAVFAMILFVPEPMPTRKIRDTVYEVNLVEMPEGRRQSFKSRTKAKTGKALSAPARAPFTKRLSKPKKKEKPVVIAKRTIKAKTQQIKPPEDSSSKRIDKALAKIEKTVKEEKKDTIDRAIPKLEARVKGSEGKQTAGVRAENGITIHLYRMEVEERIKSNWSYPVALTGLKEEKNLETIVLLKVKNNGTILSFEFKTRSGNTIFDQSALKAVKRSDPLPPFPEGYRKTDDEIEINFNLSELGIH